MIHRDNEKILHSVIHDLSLANKEEPKGIYLKEIDDFKDEMEQNLFALDKEKQSIYLKDLFSKFNCFVDAETEKRVVKKPTTKQDKNLNALVNTANRTLELITVTTIKFLDKNGEVEEIINNNPELTFRGLSNLLFNIAKSKKEINSILKNTATEKKLEVLEEIKNRLVSDSEAVERDKD
jgi:hypothetical protein